MFVSQTKLPHLLPPSSYTTSEAYQAELQGVLKASWHMVGTTAELARHGDYLTRTVAGSSLQVRNFNGKLHALSNVCAHRHAEICSQPCGNSPTMRCQYHGWEYQADGLTGKIPEPKNFVPFDRQATRLPQYALGLVGQLVFVNVSPAPLPLVDFLGEEFTKWIEARFSEQWTLALKWQPDYPANWKIPIENSLEAYHVPAVHPHTFRQDPGAERSSHGLLPNRTWFETTLPFSPHSRLDAAFQRLEGRFVRWLGHETSGFYQQHHVFPNLLFSFTDAISLASCVLPDSPQHCSAVTRQFGRLPSSNGTLRRLSAKCWSRLTAAITKRVMLEDLTMFAAIQRGMQYSPHQGMLGCCEERIHSFQEWVVRSS
ncbi:MAG: aromatic ring-hydroxylating dioxygenase subunit alpha [Planctomycetales bacterium]|nr:aromatic ring-hydroxylating dioxygenase subunit alpha [Planctomycetales bacterium]